MAPANRAPPSLPPEKGSFPLDHFGDCKKEAEEYLKCLKRKCYENQECKLMSKVYLECRMNKGLMAKEDLGTMGFVKDD